MAPPAEPTRRQRGHLLVVGLPLGSDPDDLSIKAASAIARAHRLVYPGEHLDPGLIEALGIRERLVSGRRLSTSELMKCLSNYLDEDAEVVLLVQGDPAWLSFEPGHRVSALTVARLLEECGHTVSIIPGHSSLSALCASARFDLFADGNVTGVLIASPHAEGPGQWAESVCDALSSSQTVVALMAENHVDVLGETLLRHRVQARCLMGGSTIVELSVPDELDRLTSQPAPFTLILRPQKQVP